MSETSPLSVQGMMQLKPNSTAYPGCHGHTFSLGAWTTRPKSSGPGASRASSSPTWWSSIGRSWERSGLIMQSKPLASLRQCPRRRNSLQQVPRRGAQPLERHCRASSSTPRHKARSQISIDHQEQPTMTAIWAYDWSTPDTESESFFLPGILRGRRKCHGRETSAIPHHHYHHYHSL